MIAETVTDEATGKESVIVAPDPNTAFAGCQNCHSALPGWQIPPSDIFFVDKTPAKLCEQMKFQFREPQGFVDHLDHEGDVQAPQFIAEAFKGTRGLDDQGQAVYFNETGNDYKLEPPPMGHGQQYLSALLVTLNLLRSSSIQSCG